MTIDLPWQLYAFLAAAIALPLIQRLVEERIEQRRFERAGLADVKRMSWRDFEKYLAHLFRSLGYKVELTPPSGDFGVDLILTDGTGKRIAVQAKRWKNKKVGNDAVQAVVGGAAYYKCSQTIVITTSGYSDQAVKMAKETGTHLWGLKELGDRVERIRRAGSSPAAHASTSAVATGQLFPAKLAGQAPPKSSSRKPTTAPGASTTTIHPNCPKCGASMVPHKVEGRNMWVCSKYPGCKGYRPKG